MLRRTLTVALVAGLVLAGCGDDAEEVDSGGAPVELDGTSWSLTEGVDAPEGSAFTLRFQDGQAGGRSGCNTYGGPFEQDGSSLTFGELAATMMACDDPLMTAERQYLDALGATESFSSEGETLELRNGDGDTLLTFAAPDPQAIVGDWNATGVLQRDREAFTGIMADTSITATFGDDGSLTGSGGCNNYNGTYTVDGESIQITPPAATKKLCAEPDGVMEQEAAYFTVLGEAASFTLEGDLLTLLDADGIRLVDYQRAG